MPCCSAASGRKHLVLVHGICHGAWCWYKVVSHLRSGGHRVTAVDLGGCGVHPSRLFQEIHTFSDYIQPLVQVLESLSPDEKVVLVGHSYGGLAISLAMEKLPHLVSAAVFISSYMPNCRDPPALQVKQYFKTLKPEAYLDCRFTFDDGSPTSAELGERYMAMMYRSCQPEDLALATILVRSGGFFLKDMNKESLLTQNKYGSIRRIYVVCEGDEIMNEEFQRFIVNDSPPDEVKSFPGAGHMVMLSKSQDLSLYLQEIVERYP